MKRIEGKLEELSLAVDLFKTYGFQPKEYEKYLEALKAHKPDK